VINCSQVDIDDYNDISINIKLVMGYIILHFIILIIYLFYYFNSFSAINCCPVASSGIPRISFSGINLTFSRLVHLLILLSCLSEAQYTAILGYKSLYTPAGYATDCE